MHCRLQLLNVCKVLTAAVAFALVAGCSEKSPSVTQHDAVKDVSHLSMDQTRPNLSVTNRDGSAGETLEIEAILNHGATDVSFWLHPDRATDLRLRNNDQVSQRLDAVVAIIRNKVQKSKSTEDVGSFLSLLKFECDKVLASCSGLQYLKQSPQSINLLIDVLPAQPRPLDWMSYAFLLNGRGSEKTIYRLALSNPQWDWNQWLNQSSEFSDQLLVAFKSLSNDAKNIQGVEIEKLLKWSDVLNGSWPALQTEVIEIGIQQHGESFVRQIGQHLISASSTRNGFKLLGAQKVITDKKVDLDKLNLRLLNLDDSIDVLIVGMFEGTWSTDVGVSWARALNVTEEDLEHHLANFYKINILVQSFAAHVTAKKWLSDGIETEKLFSYFLSKSSVIRSQMMSLRSQLIPISNWSLRFASEQKWSVQRFQDHLNGFDQSIKSVLSYPHMMVLFDKLASKRFTLKVFEREIQSSELMTFLMTGQLGLLSQYTESRSALGMSDILQSFQLAVDAKVFEQFGLSGDEFAAKIAGLMSVKSREFINKIKSQTESRLVVSQTYKQVAEVCAGQMRTPFRYYFAEIKASPLFGSTMQKLFTSVSDRSESGDGVKTSGLFYADKEFAEMLEYTRTDLQHALRTARALQGILASSKLKAPLVSAAVQQLDLLQNQTFEFAARLNRDVGQCLWNFSLNEKQIALELVSQEISYLKAVHQKMSSLRQGSGASVSLPEANFSSLGVAYKSQDKISADRYILNSVDAYLRFAQRLNRRTNPTGSGASPKFRVEFGSKIDLDTPVFAQATEVTLDYDSDINEFVAKGLRALFTDSSAGEPIFTWFKNGDERFQQWINDLKTKTSLFRLSRTLNKEMLSGDDIVSQHVTILRHLQMSPFERQVLKTLKRDPLYDPVFLQDRILRYDNSQSKVLSYLSLFDLLAQISKSTDLGYGWDTSVQEIKDGVRNANRPSALDLALLYYQGRAIGYKNKSLFTANTGLNSFLDQQMRALVGIEVGATRGIHQSIKNFMAKDKALPADKKLKVDISLETQIVGQYLSLGALESYEASVKKFNAQTSSCFTTNACSDLSQ